MRLDNISEPATLWYEDKDGNRLEQSTIPEMPDGWKYQYSKHVGVTESVCMQSKDPKWPVRCLKWTIRHLPRSWQGHPSQIARGEMTINCVYPIIKYLVENRKWRINEAAVAAASTCERCMNICLWELEGKDLATEQHYLDTVNTSCDYCKEIDPAHIEKKKVRACYRALKFNKDIKKAWEEGYCSHPSCEVTEARKETVWMKIKSWYYR